MLWPNIESLMPIFKNNYFIFFFLFILGCQSASVFNLKTVSDGENNRAYDQHIIYVKSNRVQQECLFYDAEAENKWRHQYLMYILNDKNEVLPIMYAINQEGGICKEQLKKIQKILKQDEYVKVCADSNLKKRSADESDNDRVDFGQLGKHKVSYEALFFDGICNSKGCFIYKNTPGCSLKAP